MQMREWSELEMSFTAGGFLSPSDGYCSAEQQLQYYGESVFLLVSPCRFAAFSLLWPLLSKVSSEITVSVWFLCQNNACIQKYKHSNLT